MIIIIEYIIWGTFQKNITNKNTGKTSGRIQYSTTTMTTTKRIFKKMETFVLAKQHTRFKLSNIITMILRH